MILFELGDACCLLLQSCADAHQPKGTYKQKPFWLRTYRCSRWSVNRLCWSGGGFMYVPALIFSVGLETKRAVGTSLLIIGLNAAVAFSRYLFDENIRRGFLTENLGELPLWLGMLTFTLLTFAGLFAGTKLAKRTDPARLRRWFAIFLMVMAVLVLVQEMSGL
ncbi:MAG: sulfite exporter TauE/SafE family protein [Candidatus Kapaibacterium sp.]